MPRAANPEGCDEQKPRVRRGRVTGEWQRSDEHHAGNQEDVGPGESGNPPETLLGIDE
jgi:hypothetical protein